tara:strand:- start:1641 stop:2105 length:465 start_codon:yes stop_codon:yes gene_type:complete
MRPQAMSMKKISSTLIVLYLAVVVIAFANAALRWSEEPFHAGACGRSGDCTSCHQGTVPDNHTEKFVTKSHGCLARENRDSCLTCHQQRQCADCHDNEKPSWHSPLFCTPAKGVKQRNEHMHLAIEHRQSCLECHRGHFQTQCSDCHVLDEWNR